MKPADNLATRLQVAAVNPTVENVSSALGTRPIWCAACGQWGDHGSGICPTITHPPRPDTWVVCAAELKAANQRANAIIAQQADEMAALQAQVTSAQALANVLLDIADCRQSEWANVHDALTPKAARYLMELVAEFRIANRTDKRQPMREPLDLSLTRYCNYIANAGGSPTLEQFDDDWSPIGRQLREQLKDAGLVYERDGRIRLCPPSNTRGEIGEPS